MKAARTFGPLTIQELHDFSDQVKAEGNWDAALELLRIKLHISTRAQVDVVARPSVERQLLDTAFEYSFPDWFWNRFWVKTGAEFAR